MAYTQDQNTDLIPLTYEAESGDLEALLDSIADALIRSQYIDTSIVENNQKFIRNGQIQTGQGDGVLALYQKDVEANVEDNLQSVADQITGEYQISSSLGIDNSIGISIIGGGFAGGGLDITNLVFSNQDGNPLNVSQFIPLEQSASFVDVDKAEEFLDTNIYELLPTGDARQARIVRFFQELNALLPPQLPQFDLDQDGSVDRGLDGSWTGSIEYNKNYSISYAQDNVDGNIDEDDAFIHRLKSTANDTNSSRTIEDIYNRVLPYLTDRLEVNQVMSDTRPEYQNESSGYLKFRNPNQGIIIRNANKDFIEGLDPSIPTWLTTDYNGLLNTYSGDAAPYDNTTNFILNNAGTGFTITMWVRFLDKVSEGTLFNFGNPTRDENPFGFKLETYVVNRDDPTVQLNNRYDSDGNQITTNTFGEFVDSSNVNGDNYFRDTLNLFKNTNSERFVRLQVREFGINDVTYDRGLRSSELGNPGAPKYTWNAPELGGTDGDDLRLLNNTNIPENFNEWYFICASYNPSIIEPNSADYPIDNIANNPLYWLNHINPATGNSVANSDFGNKCKVEIISRSNLLRARGFKVN